MIIEEGKKWLTLDELGNPEGCQTGSYAYLDGKCYWVWDDEEETGKRYYSEVGENELFIGENAIEHIKDMLCVAGAMATIRIH